MYKIGKMGGGFARYLPFMVFPLKILGNNVAIASVIAFSSEKFSFFKLVVAAVLVTLFGVFSLTFSFEKKGMKSASKSAYFSSTLILTSNSTSCILST